MARYYGYMFLCFLSSCSGGFFDEEYGNNCSHVIPHGEVQRGCYIACPYFCDPGYEKFLTYISDLSCSVRNEWQWRMGDLLYLKDLLCKPKQCQTTIPNGQLVITCKAEVGTTCEYTCREGYFINFWTPDITCETSAEWSRNPHQLCTNEQQCSYEIENGDLDLDCVRSPGITCKYKCHESYMPFDPQGEITCGLDSQWDKNSSALCKKIICPLSIPNGEISSVCSRHYSHKCYSYSCSVGFEKPPNVVALHCNSSGHWDWDMDLSKWPCLKTKDLCPKTIKNGNIDSYCNRQHGSRCSFSCNENCMKNPAYGRPLLTCKDNSEWDFLYYVACLCQQTTSTGRPECPSSIPNGHIHSTQCSFRQGQVCSFSCNNGCYPAFDNLYCTSRGYWENEVNACSCEALSTQSEKESSTGTFVLAPVIGGIIGILVIIIIIVIFVICRMRVRNNQRRQPNIAVSYRGVASNATESGIRNADLRVTPCAPPYIEPESEQHQPPPSYTEVVSDPEKFKT